MTTTLISDVLLISLVVETTLMEAIAFEFEMSLFLKFIFFLKELYFIEILLPCRNFIFIKQILAYVLLKYLNPKY